MTDLMPNDLSHLSDEEFNALCPQGEHAPGAEPLSPAAQVVLDAAMKHSGPAFEPLVSRLLADALRALDEQLGHKVLDVRCVDCSQIRLIAAELEGNNG